MTRVAAPDLLKMRAATLLTERRPIEQVVRRYTVQGIPEATRPISLTGPRSREMKNLVEIGFARCSIRRELSAVSARALESRFEWMFVMTIKSLVSRLCLPIIAHSIINHIVPPKR